MTIKENSLDIMKSKLEKYQALDFLNEGLIEHLEKKIIVHKKLFIEYRQEIDKLQKDSLYDEVMELQEENKELKEGLSNEGVLMLQDDNKRLMNDNKKRLNEIIELQADNKRLVKQVSSNRDSNSNTHTHTKEIEIQAEIDALKDKHGD